jgi:hypothetical protein
MERDGRPLVLAVCGLAFEAAIAAGPGVATLCGPGTARLADRIEARLEALQREASDLEASQRAPWPRADAPVPSGIISFGCAGGLDPALAPGSCVLGSAVCGGGERIEADPAWLGALMARLPAARPGVLAGVDAPVTSAAHKARLWRDSGACAVDMESQAAALAARRHGLPFAACRVVLDPAWRAIPPCALAGMRADGPSADGSGADGWSAPLALLACLARDPRQLAPLCTLAREAWLARRALGRVRARLGLAFALPVPGAPG